MAKPKVRTAPLTTDEQAALVAYRDQWLAIGRGTDAADRVLAEATWRKMGDAVGLPIQRVIWADGALGGMAAVLIHHLFATGKLTLSNVLERQTPDETPTKGLGDQLGAQLRDQLGTALASASWWFWDTQHWPGWWCWRDFPQQLGVEYAEPHRSRMGWWLTLAKCTGRFAMYGTDTIIACDRPALQAVDDRGRFHREDGPAFLGRDGWGFYVWHGVVVPSWVITHPEQITADAITQAPNAEVRRAMIERIGWERYLTMAKARVVQADEYGTLLELPELPEEREPLRLVRVTNSTPEPDGSYKDYILRVPPTCESAREAVAWTFSINRAEDYEPAMET